MGGLSAEILEKEVNQEKRQIKWIGSENGNLREFL
jgi:hypothetical protein